MDYLGQSQQDKFVLKILKNKRNGYFLEIGSNDPILINNSYILEKQYDWKGIMVEYDHSFLESYKIHRTNSIHLLADATTIDYKTVFENNNMPLKFDYLQIDLHVSTESTIKTLEKLDHDVFDTYKFATITFEHDIYASNSDDSLFYYTRQKSRDIFLKRGYVRVFEDVSNDDNPYEDWYVHPDLVDMNYVNLLIENNQKNYSNHPITNKRINWKHIQYN